MHLKISIKSLENAKIVFPPNIVTQLDENVWINVLRSNANMEAFAKMAFVCKQRIIAILMAIVLKIKNVKEMLVNQLAVL